MASLSDQIPNTFDPKVIILQEKNKVAVIELLLTGLVQMVTFILIRIENLTLKTFQPIYQSRLSI